MAFNRTTLDISSLKIDEADIYIHKSFLTEHKQYAQYEKRPMRYLERLVQSSVINTRSGSVFLRMLQ